MVSKFIVIISSNTPNASNRISRTIVDPEIIKARNLVLPHFFIIVVIWKDNEHHLFIRSVFRVDLEHRAQLTTRSYHRCHPTTLLGKLSLAAKAPKYRKAKLSVPR